MIQIYYIFIIIGLLNPKVVFNQNDYASSDDLDDDQSQTQFSRQGLGGRPQPGKPRDALLIDGIEAVDKGIRGIIGIGKCFIKCVFGWMKRCGGIITCPWDCLFPNQPIGRSLGRSLNSPADDEDIKLNINPKAENYRQREGSLLSPLEIVAVARCIAECLIRYLPRSPTTMADFLYCSVNQCLCA